jgi:hypothetical protein
MSASRNPFASFHWIALILIAALLGGGWVK